jgi:hypothetical protein
VDPFFAKFCLKPASLRRPFPWHSRPFPTVRSRAHASCCHASWPTRSPAPDDRTQRRLHAHAAQRHRSFKRLDGSPRRLPLRERCCDSAATDAECALSPCMPLPSFAGRVAMQVMQLRAAEGCPKGTRPILASLASCQSHVRNEHVRGVSVSFTVADSVCTVATVYPLPAPLQAAGTCRTHRASTVCLSVFTLDALVTSIALNSPRPCAVTHFAPGGLGSVRFAKPPTRPLPTRSEQRRRRRRLVSQAPW